MHDVAISVVCTDNRRALEGCLAALPPACEGLSWRATVVDNAGTDGTSEMVRRLYPWAEVLRNERRAGFSENHNRTLRRIVRDRSARHALILNDDTILDHGALSGMVSEMDFQPDLAALGPRIRGVDGMPQQSLFRFPSAAHFAIHAVVPHKPSGEPGPRGWLNGSCVLLRVDALAEVGVLDERFFIFYEDTDLGLRLHHAGWRSAMSRSAGMVHLEHQTVSMPALNSVMARQMRRSQWLYVRKHAGRSQAAALEAVVRGTLLLRALRHLVRARRYGDEAVRETAVHLIDLARYRVRSPLPHE